MIKKGCSCFGYVLCFFAVIFLLAVLFPSKNTDSSSAPKATATPVVTLSPSATPEESAIYYGSVHGGNDLTMEKAKIITQFPDSKLSLNLNIHYTGDTDSKRCIRALVEFVLLVSQDMRDCPGDFDNIQYVITSSGYVDKYGNKTTPVVFTARVDRETLSKINYSYFLGSLYFSTSQALNAFDSHYVHSLLSDGVY